jgi:predicted ATPase
MNSHERSPGMDMASALMIQLKSVRIRRFKRIDDASIDLKDVNVLVGGNNSGKSSIIQGLHFGIGLALRGSAWAVRGADCSRLSIGSRLRIW